MRGRTSPKEVNTLTVAARDARVVMMVQIAWTIASRATPREERIAR